ncbi:MAG: hypothetical protein QM698_08990 [Micropepsaceae bacterium]
MLAFLDFEASSLSDNSYPIEVAWIFEDGTGELSDPPRVMRALQAADRSAPAHRTMADAVEERTRLLTAVDLARAEQG